MLIDVKPGNVLSSFRITSEPPRTKKSTRASPSQPSNR